MLCGVCGVGEVLLFLGPLGAQGALVHVSVHAVVGSCGMRRRVEGGVLGRTLKGPVVYHKVDSTRSREVPQWWRSQLIAI